MTLELTQSMESKKEESSLRGRVALKSRVVSLLSKSKSKPGKQATIDELRAEKEDLETKLARLQEEVPLHQKSAEEARAAADTAEEERRLAVEEQVKADEERKRSIEEKSKAEEEKNEAQRIAAAHAEEARSRTSAADAASSALREATERERQALEAQLEAERRADDEATARKHAESERDSVERELRAELEHASRARDLAEDRRDAALIDAEHAISTRDEAIESAKEERKARNAAEETCRHAELYAEEKAHEADGFRCQAEAAIAARDHVQTLLAEMEETKLEAQYEASLEKSAREKAEVEMRLAEALSRHLSEQIQELREENERLKDTMTETDEALARVRDALLKAEALASQNAEAKDHTEVALRESELRVEELTVLSQDWRERAEDARSLKDDFERALEKSRDSHQDALKQVDEYRKAKERAEAEKRGAERFSQKQEAQAKKDREAAISAASSQEEAERNAKKALESFDEAQRKWKQGVQPTTTPSETQIDSLRRSRQFREGAFHVAVAGLTGTGKSSLINALIGVMSGTPQAVPTGTQYTKTIGRYVDTRRNYPHIWYDVPGAGTLTAPSWNYFNDQGLFVFDAIILVWDNRFTDVDLAILENCVKLNIPAFIVRAKSDVHITNIEERMRDVIEADPGLNNKDKKAKLAVVSFSARAEYISETRQSVELSLHNANLPQMKVYLVSNKAIVKIVQGDKNMRNVRVIDEFDLLNDVWALRRARGGSKPRMPNMRSNTAPNI